MGALMRQVLRDMKRLSKNNAFLFSKPKKDQGTWGADHFRFDGISAVLSNKHKFGAPHVKKLSPRHRRSTHSLYAVSTRILEREES